MASLDSISIGILFGSLLVLAGILSSLVAMRFGAPLLLAFSPSACWPAKPGRSASSSTTWSSPIRWDRWRSGSFCSTGACAPASRTFRNVIGPAGVLSTVGVLATAALTAPAAVLTLGLSWTEALLMGAVVASTDAAAVFFLLHARGLRLRPRVNATWRVDPASTIRSPSL